MIFVRRGPTGAITAVSQQDVAEGLSDEPGWTQASPDDPELQTFLAHVGGGEMANPLVSTDLAMARVLEDLINLLLDQSVIRFTDLPPGAQAKLLARQNTRASMSRLRLMDDGDLENREII